MDLTGRLDQILQMRPRQEIPEADELAVVLVFDINDTPAVLAAAHGAPSYNDGVFATNNSEGNLGVDAGVGSAFFFVLLIVVIGIHAQIMESELFLNALFEGHALFEGEGVGFGDHWNDVDDVRELLQHDDVDRLKSMARWLDEEETAVNASILYIAFSLCGEFFSEVA